MLINFEEINNILISENLKIEGCFHIGAHECEELSFYNSLGIEKENVIWIDAIASKVTEATNKGIPNVFKLFCSINSYTFTNPSVNHCSLNS